jgi:putative ABC transport system substrate-binding protein
MRRREFLGALSGAIAWPAIVRAQQPAMPVIGVISSSNARAWEPLVAAFRKGLGEAGFTERQNVAIEYRFADGQYERLAGMASDLVQHNVPVIAAFTTPAALAAKAATTTIPIVFTIIADPVQSGLVSNLSRPNGNVTGTAYLNVEVAPKLLELIHDAVPGARRMAVIVNPDNPGTSAVERTMKEAADKLGLELDIVHVSGARDLETAFARVKAFGAGGLVIGGDAVLNAQMGTIAAMALRQGVPTIYPSERFAAAGGLMSYAGSASDGYQRAGVYVGRILRGEKPANLPVQQTTKVELVINMKTARALGITMPLSLLGRADAVLE